MLNDTSRISAKAFGNELFGGRLTGYSEHQTEGLCKFIRIDSAIPGGVAPADSGFTKVLLDHSVACASSEPTGLINFPMDWTR